MAGLYSDKVCPGVPHQHIPGMRTALLPTLELAGNSSYSFVMSLHYHNYFLFHRTCEASRQMFLFPRVSIITPVDRRMLIQNTVPLHALFYVYTVRDALFLETVLQKANNEGLRPCFTGHRTPTGILTLQPWQSSIYAGMLCFVVVRVLTWDAKFALAVGGQQNQQLSFCRPQLLLPLAAEEAARGVHLPRPQY